MIRAWLVGLCALSWAWASYGSSPIAIVTGNGRMTVALDQAGGLTHVSWPGPGSGQHLDDDGARWYLATSEGLEPFSPERWSISQDYGAADSMVVRTVYTEIQGSRRAEQTVAAIPERDLLLIRLRLQGFAPETRFFWAQSFSPCDRLLPGLATFQPAVRTMNGFAAGFDSEARLLEHLHPAAPGQAEWAGGRSWVRGGVYTEAGPGIYLGTASTNDIVQGSVCGEGASWRGWRPPAPLPGAARIGQNATGIMELTPRVSDSSLELVVFLGASDSRDGLHQLLGEVNREKLAELEASAARPGGAWGVQQPHDGTAPPERRWLNLLLSIDPATGASLSAPVLSDSANYCDVLTSAWCSAALDRMGLTDAAERALGVHMQTVRLVAGLDTPTGSLPRRVYRNGVAATLDGHADPESAAWFLAACWRHGAMQAAEPRRAYFEGHWETLSRCADYLAREPRVGGALSGALAAEAAPLEVLRAHYLGLESSRRMAEAQGLSEPGLWADRREEIYARLRFRALNQTGAGAPVGPWIGWWVRQLPGAGAESGTGWMVLESESTGALDELAILEWTGGAIGATSALRDALRCLAGP